MHVQNDCVKDYINNDYHRYKLLSTYFRKIKYKTEEKKHKRIDLAVDFRDESTKLLVVGCLMLNSNYFKKVYTTTSVDCAGWPQI